MTMHTQTPRPSLDRAHSVVEDSSNYTTLFHQAITAFTACSAGGTSSSFRDLDCFGVGRSTCSTPKSTRISTAANQQARKIMSRVSQQMSASNALIQDAELISAFLERLLS